MTAFQDRRRRIQDTLTARKTDLFFVCSEENLYYLMGVSPCHSPACALIPANGASLLVAAESETPAGDEFGIRTYPDDTLVRPCEAVEEMCSAVAAVIKDMTLPHERVGFEGKAIPGGLVSLAGRFHTEDLSPHIGRMRRVKDGGEIEEIRAAVALADFVQRSARGNASPGMSEIELFSALQAAVQKRAGRPVRFQGDLLAGDRALLMGGPPGTAKLRESDVAILDFQLCAEHYWADTARTLLLGKPPDALKRVYETVADALERATRAAGPGVPASDVDRAAREFIASHGYAGNFPHHTGHGCGLSYYEPPLIVPNNREPLAEGMVLCLEPGIYVPGVGGVRLENMVLIESSGARVLSRAPIMLDGGGE